MATEQEYLGHPGQANALVVRTRTHADATRVRRQLSATLASRFPEVGFTIKPLGSERHYRLLYDDIEGDQRLYNIFAALILAGAAFAAFNLTGRIVEAQRREIGIGMALGVPGPRLAIRPLLVAFQIALVGALAGVVVGLVVAQLVLGVLRDFFPLPVWRQPFQLGVYVRGLALGIAVPFAAAAFPVWRALRVTPVEAIRTGATAARGGRLMVLLRRIPSTRRSRARRASSRARRRADSPSPRRSCRRARPRWPRCGTRPRSARRTPSSSCPAPCASTGRASTCCSP
jgi:putative ABC transport system permease protein